MIHWNPSVCSSTKLPTNGGRAIAKALQHHETLRMLELHHDSITDDSMQDFADVLKHNKKMEWLSLPRNQITDVGATIIATALHHSTTLRTLHLSRNHITDVGAQALAHALQHNQTLSSLHLHENPILKSLLRKTEELAKNVKDRGRSTKYPLAVMPSTSS